MALDSYALTRTYSFSDKIKEMRREKLEQINALYDLAADREENTTMNFAMHWMPLSKTQKTTIFGVIDLEHLLIPEKMYRNIL